MLKKIRLIVVMVISVFMMVTIAYAAVPGAPTGQKAVPGNTSASVFFKWPSANGGSLVLSYTATCVQDPTKTATGPTSPLVVTGLTNGTSYTFTVVATNIDGSSVASGATTGVIPTVVPNAPTIGTATLVSGKASATVTFTAPANTTYNNAVTGYTVTANPGNISASAAASPIKVVGLKYGTAYTFTVVATNQIGTGPASGTSNVVTPDEAATVGGSLSYIGGLDTDGRTFSVCVDENYAYLAEGVDSYNYAGIKIIDISNPAAPTVVSNISNKDANGVEIPLNSLVKVGNYLIVAKNQSNTGLLEYDVSNPANPVLMTNASAVSNAIKLTAVGDLIYISDGTNFVRIYRVAANGVLTQVSYVAAVENRQNISVSGNYAYCGSTLGFLCMYDVSTPSTPVVKKSSTVNSYKWTVDDLGVTARPIADVFAQGNLVYMVDSTNTAGIKNLMRIIDVSDYLNPRIIGTYEFAAQKPQGFVYVKGDYCYTGGADGYITILNISNPATPIFVSSLLPLSPTASPKMMVMKNNILYVANQQKGLTIFATDQLTISTPVFNNITTATNNIPNLQVGNIGVNVNIANNLDANSNASIILALYNGTQLEGVKFVQKSVGNGAKVNFNDFLTVADTAGRSIKCMMWNGMDTMTPINKLAPLVP